MDEQEDSRAGQDKVKTILITDLPDEVLLQVFQYLSPKDLMSGVSLVCSRWFRLSRDEETWRFVQLDSSSPYLTHTLRVAPALASLHLYSRVDEVVDLVVGQHKPRIRELLVYNDDRQTRESLFALLRETLGLQSLKIIGEMSTELLQLIDSLPLIELYIAAWSASRFEFHGRGLQSLVLHSPSDQLARDLIDAHCATLQRVLLSLCWEEDTLKALGKCQQLRETRVLCSPALRYLEPLPHLRFLKVELGDARSPEETLRFLARSNMLTRITRCRVYCGEPTKGLLKTLAERTLQLRSLILSTYIGEFPDEQFLELCHFAGLEELTMKNVTVPAALLHRIAKGALPKLKTLNVHQCDEGAGAHAALQALKERRPQLRILPLDFGFSLFEQNFRRLLGQRKDKGLRRIDEEND